ncbi:MAG: hypothetical protein OEY94_05555 [Alphaproteobacteria bacterium]|nr:hypothetical protein [Alphaproteobacteria bacterium]
MYKTEKLIGHNEKLISLRRPHWIYLAEGFFWLLLMTAVGFLIEFVLFKYAGSKILYNYGLLLDVNLRWVTFDQYFTPFPAMMFGVGLAVFWPYFLIYISTEIALTSQRIIHKRGLIFVNVDQVDLEDIRAEHVDHGLMGWFIGYGAIKLDCRFIDDVRLPAIGEPYKLVRASHNARLKNSAIDYGEEEFSSHDKRIKAAEQNNNRKEKMARLKAKMKASFRKAT